MRKILRVRKYKLIVCPLLILAATVILLMGVCGCMTEPINRAEQVKGLVLDYLNERYDDSFSAQAYSAESWAYRYESMSIASAKYDAFFTVRVFTDHETPVLIDNYYHLFMQSDAEEFFQIVAADFATAVKVRFQESIWSDELAGSESFADYVKSGLCDIDVFFLTNKDLAGLAAEERVQALAESKIRGTFKFIRLKPKALTMDLTVSQLYRDYAELVQEERSFFINREFAVAADQQ